MAATGGQGQGTRDIRGIYPASAARNSGASNPARFPESQQSPPPHPPDYPHLLHVTPP